MILNNKCIGYYSGTYRKGLFGKKHDTKVLIYTDTIEGIGHTWHEDELSSETEQFRIEMNEITEIYIKEIEGNIGIWIEYLSNQSIVSKQIKYQIIMGIDQYIEAVELIKKVRLEDIQKRKQEKDKKQEELRVHEHKIEVQESVAKKFYNDCYDYHISKEDNPYFNLYRDRYVACLLYIDRKKDLNFLRIDGYNQEEFNGIIPYSKIHYFEKAGAIHYTTEINSQYSSFAGNITGASFSKKTSLWAGLLLGPMGMAAGALLTHKPTMIELPNIELNVESSLTKIDERNVILNYYSDTQKQYIDMELPQEIYNFLQTYLGEKRYEIVMEEEKIKASQAIQLEDFKIKLEKLKMMYDMGILTELEFDNEKMKLLV